jgi:hypothetical protein
LEAAAAIADANEEDTAAAPADPSAVEGEEEPDVNDIQWAFTPPPPLSEASVKKVDDIFEKMLFLDMIEIHLLPEVVQERLGIAGDVTGGGGTMAAMAGAGGAVEE